MKKKFKKKKKTPQDFVNTGVRGLGWVGKILNSTQSIMCRK